VASEHPPQKFGLVSWLTRIDRTWGIIASLMGVRERVETVFVLEFSPRAPPERLQSPGVIYYFQPAGLPGCATGLKGGGRSFLSGSGHSFINSRTGSRVCPANSTVRSNGWQMDVLIIRGLMFRPWFAAWDWFCLDSLPLGCEPVLTADEKSALTDTCSKEGQFAPL